jgi:hypothetical protein
VAELQTEAYGPDGDSAHHRSLAELDAGFHALTTLPPTDSGRVALPRDPDAPLAVMRRDVAELIANGQPLTLFGDNLFVELDLSAANLPVGARLRLGEAEAVVTAKPHNGCRKFNGRFGQDALRFVQQRPTRDQNFRGIYWKTIASGEVAVGDPIQVISRS